MFGISINAASVIFALIAIGLTCLFSFFGYTRHIDLLKRIKRFEKAMEDINSEIFKIHKWIKDSELESKLSNTALNTKIKKESVDAVNNGLVSVKQQIEILENQIEKEREYIEEKLVSLEEKIREFGYSPASSSSNIDQKRIVSMFRDGWSIDAIAKEMRLGKGEVEFTLKLADIKA